MYNIKKLNTGKWLNEEEEEYDSPVDLSFSTAVRIHNKHLENLDDYSIQNSEGYGVRVK